MDKKNWAVLAGVFVFIVLGGVTAYFFTQGTFADVTSKNRISFMTNPGASCYYGDISNGMQYYGKQVYVENLEPKQDSLDTQALATVHYGKKSKTVKKSEFPVTIGDLKFSLVDTDSEYVTSGISCGQYQYDRDYINNIIWSLDVVVPKDKVTVSVSSIQISDVKPGVKKVDASLKLSNEWQRFRTDKVSVKILGKRKTIDSGIIEKGTDTYNVTIKKSYYDASKFLVNKQVNGSVQVFFKNPKIPQSQVSGKPDQDGNYQTWESWEPGGVTFDVRSYKDDPEYATVQEPCDYQFLKDNGLGTDACNQMVGGELDPMHTKNWMFPLNQFKSVKKEFTTDVKYCGENATYKNGQCVIDEELHLRGDLCPLLQNHQIVTETFPAGSQIKASQMEPQPAFFCTKHPALVTNADGQQTSFNSEIYRKLVDGETVQVPEGKTYTLYWTVDTTEVNVTTVCKQGSLNKTTGECVRTPGVTHKCSQGVYDPSTGSCVVEPEVTEVCQVGRYNSELGKCQYEPDANNKCSLGYYDNATDSCLAPSTVKQVCPESATMKNGECRVDPAIVKQSPLDDLRQAFMRVWSKYTVHIVGGVASLMVLIIGGFYWRRKGSSSQSSRFRNR